MVVTTLFLYLLQLTAHGNEIFEAVVTQADLPRGYTHSMLKDDMLTYLNKNSNFFMVTKLFVSCCHVISITM